MGERSVGDAYLPADARTLVQQIEFRRRSLRFLTMFLTAFQDQAVLAGVGNWVADEVLHEAKLHPSEKVTQSFMWTYCGRMAVPIRISSTHDSKARIPIAFAGVRPHRGTQMKHTLV